MKKEMKVRRMKYLVSKNLTPRKFAESIGVDAGTVYPWLRGDREPRNKYLEAVLAVHPEWPHKA